MTSIATDKCLSAPATATDALKRLAAADLRCVYEHLVFKGKIQSSDIGRLDREFKRFFALAVSGEKPIAMISPLIDEVWHQFILFTENYKQFCDESVGFFVHHRPDTSAVPVPKAAGENFLVAYEAEFGSLPSIWWKGMSRELVNHYRTRPVSGPPAEGWSGWTGRQTPNSREEASPPDAARSA